MIPRVALLARAEETSSTRRLPHPVASAPSIRPTLDNDEAKKILNRLHALKSLTDKVGALSDSQEGEQLTNKKELDNQIVKNISANTKHVELDDQNKILLDNEEIEKNSAVTRHNRMKIK